MRTLFALCAMATTATAEPEWDVLPVDLAILDVLGGHGCTLSEASAGAVTDAGYTLEALQRVASVAQVTGQAALHGDYSVFNEDICTIRLPEITSRWSPTDPVILAAAPFTRSEFTLGQNTLVDEGCFLENAIEAFTVLNGGDAEAGFRDYIAFAAAGVISGEVRFYSDSPLRTPPGLQLLVGEECKQGANVPDIEATHAFIETGFGPFIRAAFAANSCEDGGFLAPPDVVMGLQGVDISRDLEGQGPVNTSIWVEWTFVTLAAGWHEGVGATEKGMPRPPLCQYR